MLKKLVNSISVDSVIIDIINKHLWYINPYSPFSVTFVPYKHRLILIAVIRGHALFYLFTLYHNNSGVQFTVVRKEIANVNLKKTTN